MSTSKVLLGVLAGVAVGATLGILFAPDKGSATRKKISKKSHDYAEDLSQKFNDFIESITKKFEKVKEEAIHIFEKGETKREEIVAERIAYTAGDL
jgi:gas vesicle protein